PPPRPATSAPATAPAPTTRRSLTVTCTEQELNAAFEKWETAYDWRDASGAYISDPRIVLHEGRLIVAGDVKDMGTLISLHFHPRVDDKGRLRFELERILGGRLPLPESAFDGYRDKLEQKVLASLPGLQRGAQFKPDGSANEKAVAACFAELLLHVLEREPAEPVLFLPANQGACVPVKLTDVAIDGKSIALTVQLMSAQERKALLGEIRMPYRGAAARGTSPAAGAGLRS